MDRKVELMVLLLKWTLMALAGYFALVAAAHMSGMKIPLLFVYYNVESHAYQDKIISFLMFGWAAFFFTTALDPLRYLAFVRASLVAGIGAVAALSFINLSTDFNSISTDATSGPFWIETGILGLVVA